MILPEAVTTDAGTVAWAIDARGVAVVDVGARTRLGRDDAGTPTPVPPGPAGTVTATIQEELDERERRWLPSVVT